LAAIVVPLQTVVKLAHSTLHRHGCLTYRDPTVTDSTHRMRLFRVHPLDAPLVALSYDPNGKGAAAVRAHAGSVMDRIGPLSTIELHKLTEFIGEAPLTGYGLSEAVGALADTGITLPESLWDLSELAGVLMPGAAELSLIGLVRRLTSDGPGLPDTADGDLSDPQMQAELALIVYQALIDRARQEPVATLRRLADLLARSHSSLADLFIALADAPAPSPIFGSGDVGQRELAARLERPRPIGSAKPLQPLDPDEITRLLSGDGPLADAFPRYEPRLEQIAMARAVANSFGSRSNGGEPHHLVVEGGTGIGKSVAYLLPAVLFAARNNVRVVISTNTINLQEQLVSKDIPDLLAVLKGVPGLDLSKFRYTQMKGKANYLCFRRWEALANSDMTSPDDARTIAKTLLWLRETRTGDRAELGLRGRDLATWDRISASGFSGCPGAREGACFYRHARDEANSAHLLVVNHSLLLSNLQVGGTVLPDFDYLIVDEAHNLEDEATRQFGFHVAQATFEELVERLGNAIHSLGNVLTVSRVEEQKAAAARSRMEEAQLPLYKVRDTWAKLGSDLQAFAAVQRAEESGDDGELRITGALRAQPAWSELEIAWDAFERAAAESADRAESLLKAMEDLPEEVVPGLEGLKGNAAEWLGDQSDARLRIAGFVSDPDDAMVYWLGRGNGPLSMNGAPLEVGSRLGAELFAEQQTVVLTSATLAVRGGFQHVRERLGIEEPEELCLGSPFDYKRSALLCLPDDVPEPSDHRYSEAVARIIGDLAGMTGGHTMALFTSHAGVRSSAAALKRQLAGQGIAVLAQGVDGPPQQVLAWFQADPKAVLLGTSSFWEGVDIQDNALKILVVARLPFNVPTEPVFAARSGLYDQPFMQYAVPQAVLRFRQGFGRLIRNKTDHGVVVVLDRRITSKPYGRAFLDSIPPATVLQAPMADVMSDVSDWLASPGGA
jgi:DNA polymerase-3 subunit epsilon/ATP-dependent DNA helicase DinG